MVGKLLARLEPHMPVKYTIQGKNGMERREYTVRPTMPDYPYCLGMFQLCRGC